METQKHQAQKPATLDDVAAQARVTRMAVSVVLNGSRSGTRVSAATRQRILDIAQELNYRPNSVARSLARRATHIFGFYSGFNYFDARNPFVAEMTAGLLEACAACKRDLLLHSVFRGQVISGLYEELLSGKVDGLVVWGLFQPGKPGYPDRNREALEAQQDLLPENLRGDDLRFYDAFKPAACDLYWSQIRDELSRKGFDGWWLDASEPEVDMWKFRQAPTAAGPGALVLNAYPLMHTIGVSQGQLAADRADARSS